MHLDLSTFSYFRLFLELGCLNWVKSCSILRLLRTFVLKKRPQKQYAVRPYFLFRFSKKEHTITTTIKTHYICLLLYSPLPLYAQLTNGFFHLQRASFTTKHSTTKSNQYKTYASKRLLTASHLHKQYCYLYHQLQKRTLCLV